MSILWAMGGHSPFLTRVAKGDDGDANFALEISIRTKNLHYLHSKAVIRISLEL